MGDRWWVFWEMGQAYSLNKHCWTILYGLDDLNSEFIKDKIYKAKRIEEVDSVKNIAKPHQIWQETSSSRNGPGKPLWDSLLEFPDRMEFLWWGF